MGYYNKKGEWRDSLGDKLSGLIPWIMGTIVVATTAFVLAVVIGLGCLVNMTVREFIKPHVVTVKQGDKIQTYQSIHMPTHLKYGGMELTLKDGRHVVVTGDEIEYHPTNQEAK